MAALRFTIWHYHITSTTELHRGLYWHEICNAISAEGLEEKVYSRVND